MSRYYRVSSGEKFKSICIECGVKSRELAEYNYLPTLDLFDDQVLILPSEGCAIKEFLDSMKNTYKHEFILQYHCDEIYILFLECNIKFKNVKYIKIDKCYIQHRAFCIRELICSIENPSIDYIAESNIKCNKGKGTLIRSLLYGSRDCTTEAITECTTETIYRKVEGRTYTICQLQHNQYEGEPVWR